MENVVEQMRHRKERLYGRLLMTFGVLLWAVLAAALGYAAFLGQYSVLYVVALYALVIWVTFIVGHFLLRAYIYGHFVLVGPEQFPHLHQMVVEGAAAVNLPEIPKTFVF